MGNTHVLSVVTSNSKSIFKEFEEKNTRQNQQIPEGCARNNLANIKEFQSPVNIPRMQLHMCISSAGNVSVLQE